MKFLRELVAAETDRKVAAFLAAQALVEIRYLAGAARREEPGVVLADDVERIRFLADLCHNLPGVARAGGRRARGRSSPRHRQELAMVRRPMAWTWEFAGPEGRAWILHYANQVCRWEPPPPLPATGTGAPLLSWRQRIGWYERWPVRRPRGRRALPRQGRVLKAVDTDALCALYSDGFPWLRAHLDPEGMHYLVPDPSDFQWPGPEGTLLWECRVLVRMSDGEQVTSTVEVAPETFTALPSTVPRRRQRQLLHLGRALERDIGLWGRDHKDDCGPETCGYPPVEPAAP